VTSVLVGLRELLITVQSTVDEWLRIRWSSLTFFEARSAMLLFVVLLAAAVLVLLVRGIRTAGATRSLVALPAIVPGMRWSPGASIRHVPLVLFMAGVFLFAIALADPHTGFAQEDVSYPGRRVELLVDASTSMVLKFDSATLNKQGESTFYTAVAAAETFMKRRMAGPYHDLIALIQFGNEAYVVTPFTTDYENVRLSIRLISDPKEWGRFNDWGTTIVQGIDQGVQLFKAFDFVNASGNLMILFTDGRDSELNRQGRPVEALLAEARRYRIPVYMVRTAYKQGFGRIEQDKLWKDIVERTGGRFYAADNEESIMNALREIDRLSPGTIDVRQYSVQRPRYAGYALAAVALWLLAALLKLSVPAFRTFP
jgi:Ca-activated chloride channel family protein